MHSLIVKNFNESSEWVLGERNGYRYFTNSKIECDPFMPLIDENKIIKCTKQDSECSDYCQGTYSAYFLSKSNEILLRACRRQFANRRNEFIVPKELFINSDINGIAKILSYVWDWTHM